MNIQEFYKKFKTVKLTHDTITWILLVGIMFCFTVRINDLNKKVGDLSGNQTLILYQLEDNENSVKKVNKDVVKVVQNVANIDNIINKSAKEFGIDPALLHAVATVESGKNQNAKSGSGAVGVMQVLPSTARSMGENPYTTEGNIRSGAKYLAYLKNKYNGDEALMISAYNAGEGSVAKNGNIPPKYTHKYIQKVQNEKSKYSGSGGTTDKTNVVVIHPSTK